MDFDLKTRCRIFSGFLCVSKRFWFLLTCSLNLMIFFQMLCVMSQTLSLKICTFSIALKPPQEYCDYLKLWCFPNPMATCSEYLKFWISTWVSLPIPCALRRPYSHLFLETVDIGGPQTLLQSIPQVGALGRPSHKQVWVCQSLPLSSSSSSSVNSHPSWHGFQTLEHIFPVFRGLSATSCCLVLALTVAFHFLAVTCSSVHAGAVHTLGSLCPVPCLPSLLLWFHINSYSYKLLRSVGGQDCSPGYPRTAPHTYLVIQRVAKFLEGHTLTLSMI